MLQVVLCPLRISVGTSKTAYILLALDFVITRFAMVKGQVFSLPCSPILHFAILIFMEPHNNIQRVSFLYQGC